MIVQSLICLLAGITLIVVLTARYAEGLYDRYRLYGCDGLRDGLYFITFTFLIGKVFLI
jgi:hypothetical protein